MRLFSFLRRQQRDKELEEEIGNHLQMSIRDRIERGETVEQAESSARRELGNIPLIKEVTRDMWGWRWFEQLAQDIRYAGRLLRRTPGFTAVAVLTLALGIGANTAIFSFVNSILLRPLPYPEPDRIVQIWETYLPRFAQIGVSTPDYYEFRDHAQSFSSVAGYRYVAKGFNLTDVGEPLRIQASYATANLFSLLGASASAGRTFLPDEDQPGHERVTLISHKLWQGRFGSNPNLIGQTIKLNGVDYRVIGVLPAGFDLPKWADVWLPVGLMEDELTSRQFHPLSVIARLKPGVSLAQARAEVSIIEDRLRQEYPQTSKGWGASVTSLQEDLVGKIRPTLLLLFGAVGLVLLIACTNVANLLLAKSVERRREIALRTALGATRGRVLRQLLAESTLLSLLGGAAGLLLATETLRLIIALGPADLPRLNEIGLDGRALGFTIGMIFLTGLICGLLPALQASNPQLGEILKQGSNSSPTGFHRHTRRLLVISEVALALILLIGAGLLVKSFRHLLEVDPGFRTDHLLTMRVSLANEDDLTNGGADAALFKQITDRIQTLPGVSSVAGVSSLLLDSEALQRTRFLAEGQQITDSAILPVAEYRVVTNDYFKTMSIPLLQGRRFTEQDWASQNVIINQAMARRYWPDQDPIGKRINQAPFRQQPFWITVVGVAGNVKQTGLDGEQTLDIYLVGGWTRNLIVRTDSDPLSLAAAVTREIRAVNNQLPISDIATMDQQVAKSVAPKRFSMLLLGIFASAALLLAAIGIYGVMSYSVNRRAREIGIRIALGAQSGAVFKLVITEGMTLVLVGLAFGTVGAIVASRLIAGFLFGVSATDPAAFVEIEVLMAAVALLAIYLPAHRAVKVDPMVALRYE